MLQFKVDGSHRMESTLRSCFKTPNRIWTFHFNAENRILRRPRDELRTSKLSKTTKKLQFKQREMDIDIDLVDWIRNWIAHLHAKTLHKKAPFTYFRAKTFDSVIDLLIHLLIWMNHYSTLDSKLLLRTAIALILNGLLTGDTSIVSNMWRSGQLLIEKLNMDVNE